MPTPYPFPLQQSPYTFPPCCRNGSPPYHMHFHTLGVCPCYGQPMPPPPGCCNPQSALQHIQRHLARQCPCFGFAPPPVPAQPPFAPTGPHSSWHGYPNWPGQPVPPGPAAAPFFAPPQPSAQSGNQALRGGENSPNLPSARFQLIQTNQSPDQLADRRMPDLDFSIKIMWEELTVGQAIAMLGGDSKKGAITEMFELGCGRWRKGRTIKCKDDKAKKTIKDVGWGAQRGGSILSPVWVVITKSD